MFSSSNDRSFYNCYLYCLAHKIKHLYVEKKSLQLFFLLDSVGIFKRPYLVKCFKRTCTERIFQIQIMILWLFCFAFLRLWGKCTYMNSGRLLVGISLWLNDEILFWDLPLPSIYFYNLKKRRGEKVGGVAACQHSILVLKRNQKSRPDRKGLFDFFSKSQCEAFGVNFAPLDIGESQLCCCGFQSLALWVRSL